MRKIILLGGLWLLILGHFPPTIQANHPKQLPRFGNGVALIRRPAGYSDYDFNPTMTDDFRYVVSAAGGENPDSLFRWDISNMGDDFIEPTPDALSLTSYLNPDDYYNHINVTVVGKYAVVQVGKYLLKVDIETLAIEEQIHFEGWRASSFNSLVPHSSMVMAFYEEPAMIVVWDIEAGGWFSQPFTEYVDRVEAFSQGWILWGVGGISNQPTTICTPHLEQCETYSTPGNFSVEVGGLLAFGEISTNAENRYAVTHYYTYGPTDGLEPAPAIFPEFSSDSALHSISPDGQYILAERPIEDPEENTGGGWRPLTYYSMWRVEKDSVTEISQMSAWAYPVWFGEHFIANSTSLLNPENGEMLDSFYYDQLVGRAPIQNWYSYIDSHNHAYHLEQVNDERWMYVTGANAVVLPIEYQQVDDLLTLGEPAFTLERQPDSQVRLSPDGETLITLTGTTLEARDIASQQTRSLDLNAYWSADFKPQWLARANDVFIQTPTHLLSIDLADLSVAEMIEVADTLAPNSYFEGSPYFRGRLSISGSAVGALYDKTVVVWQNGTVETYEFGEFGLALRATEKGWLIHRVNGNMSEVIACDSAFAGCNTYAFGERLYTIWTDGTLTTVPLWSDAEDRTPYFWQMDGANLTEVPAPFVLPDEWFRPTEIRGNYALVEAPGGDYYNSPTQFQVWSVASARQITRQTFSGSEYWGRSEWLWYGDYLLISDYADLVLLHLPDGRYTRVELASPILDLQWSEAGSLLLVMTENTVMGYHLGE